MSYELKVIQPQILDDFFCNYKGEKSFLQTSNYAEFRTNLGEKSECYGVYSGDNLVATTIIQYIPAKKGSFLHIPHGILSNDENVWSWFLDEYKKLGKEKKVDFVRISPLLPVDKKEIFAQKKYIDAATHLQNPELTWVLDLSPSEEELVAAMEKSTRYEIRRIEKLGVETQMGNRAEDLEIFWKLHEETVKRQKFVPFPKSNTEKEMKIWGEDCQIFSSKWEEEYRSSSVILFDEHAGYYHQGASERCKAPVAYASLWAAICEAKRRGCTEFNFWGVVHKEQKDHPWYGLSKFKRGFGGAEKEFLHAQDFPLTKKYHLARTIEKYRKWKRNY